MHIKIQPQDDEEATLMLASNIRHLATADVPAPKVTILKMQPIEQSNSQAEGTYLLSGMMYASLVGGFWHALCALSL